MNDDVFVSVSSGNAAVPVPEVSDASVSVSSGDAAAPVPEVPDALVSVSSGDAAMQPDILCCCSPAVSSGDTVVEVDVSFPPEQFDSLSAKVDYTNYLLSALLFFGICVWLESKVHKGLRRIFSHGVK